VLVEAIQLLGWVIVWCILGIAFVIRGVLALLVGRYMRWTKEMSVDGGQDEEGSTSCDGVGGGE
jgi:Na+-driven multidrug efflux pump